MFSRNRDHTHESGTVGRNKPGRSQRPRCMFSSKEPRPRHQMMTEDGVSTYLALIFGTLLSSQGTDASFKTISPVSPGASFFIQLSRSVSPGLTSRFSFLPHWRRISPPLPVSLSGFPTPLSRAFRPPNRDSIHPAFLPWFLLHFDVLGRRESETTHRLTTCPVGGNRSNLLGAVGRVNGSAGRSFQLFEFDARGRQHDVAGQVDGGFVAGGEVRDAVALDGEGPTVSGV